VGKITRVEWTNPHSYLYIDVIDDKGNVTNWGCEAAGPLSAHAARLGEGRLEDRGYDCGRWLSCQGRLPSCRYTAGDLP
jgi:hypothetical protein